MLYFFFAFSCYVQHYAKREPDCGGADPAEAEGIEREIFCRRVSDDAEGERVLYTLRQRGDKVEYRGKEREGRYGNVDRAVIAEESAEKRKQYQRDCERIEEHQHGDGVLDYRREADICYKEGENAEKDGLKAVTGAAGKHFGEAFRAACNEADSGFEAGEGDGNREDDRSAAPEIV